LKNSCQRRSANGPGRSQGAVAAWSIQPSTEPDKGRTAQAVDGHGVSIPAAMLAPLPFAVLFQIYLELVKPPRQHCTLAKLCMPFFKMEHVAMA